MDLAEDEDFGFKHPYFFENYTFKFEGLKPEVKENFENIVKRMGATVSDQAQYVFIDTLYILLDPKKNYYSLSYLSNSVLAEKPLEIEDYNFKNLIQDSNQSKYCCVNARYIWKNACMNYCNQYFCCKVCMRKRRCDLLKENDNISVNQDNGNTNNANIHDFNEEQHLPIKEVNSLNVDKNSNNSLRTIGVENHNASIKSLSNGLSQDNQIHKNNSSASSDIEIVEIHSGDNLNKPSCSTQEPKKPKTNKSSTINKWKRVRKLSSNSDSSSNNSDICLTRKKKSKHLRLSSSPSAKTERNKSSSSESSSNEEQNFIKRLDNNMTKKEWWLHLPTPRKTKQNYVEPKVKARGRGRDYTYIEKRLMIAYLVKNDLIEHGTSRRPWKDMLYDGYLQGRTVESLNNHYRKVLLPNIESFKLPEYIEQQFKDERKRYRN